jgi:hypothetical protein
MSIIKMMDRLKPKKIVVVSSAPQIRYPDCYGIDMANLESLVAFKAALALLKDNNQKAPDLIDIEYINNSIFPVEEKSIVVLKEKLRIDPPLKPNLKRVLNTYTSKFQFVELKFTGGNFHIKKIKLPKNALPFKDSELNKAIEASLRLFTNIPEKDFFNAFFELKDHIDEIRFNYLTHIKVRNKNLIVRDVKNTFISEVDELKSQLEQVTLNQKRCSPQFPSQSH